MERSSPGVGVVTTDRSLVVRSWNGWLANVSGLREDEVCGRSLLDLLPDETRDSMGELLGEVIASGSSRVLAPAFHRFLIPCPPQVPSRHFERMQQQVTIAPVVDAGAVAGLIITIDDVTMRRDSERDLAEQMAAGQPVAARDVVAAVGAADWKVRGAAVRALRQSSTRDDIAHLLDTLQRDHQNLNVLSSALQVLVAGHVDVIHPLLQLLADPDANLRMHAALALGTLADPAAVPSLVAALDDPDANVRFHAIEALGQMRAADAAPALARIAQSGDFFLAFPAIDALARIDDVSVGPTLIALLDRDTLRPAVIDALGVLGDEDCLPELIERLNNGTAEPTVVATALERIYRRYEETVGAGLQIVELTRITCDDRGRARLADALQKGQAPLAPLIMVLGWIGDVSSLVSIVGDTEFAREVDDALTVIGPAAVAPLIAHLEHGSRGARLAAAALLGRLGDRHGVPPLIAALPSADSALATAAATALATLGDGRALDALLSLFGHESTPVRQAAIAAVNAIGATGTLERILDCLGDRDARVRESGIRVAGYFGFEECVPGIIAGLSDRDEDVRRAAIEQLPVLEQTSSVALLLSALKGEIPRNRAAAAHAMRHVDPAIASPALVASLSDDDAWVRYFAAQSLGTAGRREAASALYPRAVTDPAPHVRIAAIAALGRLDPAGIVTAIEPLVADPDDDIACAGIAALSAATDERADDILEHAVQGGRAAVRLAAVVALISRNTVRAPAILAWVAQLPDSPELASRAIAGLQRHAAEGLARADAVTALLNLSQEPPLREAVIAALGSLPTPVIAELDAAMPSTDSATRVVVIEALTRMRHPRASDVILRALADPEATVRSAAVSAFGRLGTRLAAAPVAAMQASDPDDGVRRRAAAVCRRHGWTSGAPGR